MTIDAIVGRPSNIDRFSRNQFGYNDTREAFDLFAKEIKALEKVDVEALTALFHSLKDMELESAHLAARSLRWALSNRKHYVK
jgi:hypothetical protein